MSEIALAKEISEMMMKYTEEVKEKLTIEFDDVANEALGRIQETAPKRYGEYAKSWTIRKTNLNRILHVKAPHYRLTHLLEKGHAKRNGGRVGAQPHIAPVEEFVNKEVEKRVIKALGG